MTGSHIRGILFRTDRLPATTGAGAMKAFWQQCMVQCRRTLIQRLLYGFSMRVVGQASALITSVTSIQERRSWQLISVRELLKSPVNA